MRRAAIAAAPSGGKTMRIASQILLATLLAAPAFAQTGNAILTFESSTITTMEGSAVTMTIRRTGNVQTTASTEWGTANNSPPGPGLVQMGGTLTFAPNEVAKTITFNTLDNPFYELSRYRNGEVRLFNPGPGTAYGNGFSQHGASINVHDNEPAPLVLFEDVSVTEGTSAQFRLRLSVPVFESFDLRWFTVEGTAKTGLDFPSASGTLRFPQGTVEQTMSVLTVNDSEIEDPETFEVRLSALGTPIPPLSDTSSRCTIVSDDGAQFVMPLSLDVGAGVDVTLNFMKASAVKETITLSVVEPSVLTVPATLDVPAGARSIVVPIKAVGPGRGTVIANIPSGLGGGRAEGSVLATLIGQVLFAQTAVTVPQGRSVDVSLSMVPPQPEPVSVALRASTAGVLDFPLSVVIPPGQEAKITLGGKTKGNYVLIATLSQIYASRSASVAIFVADPVAVVTITRVSPNSGPTAGGTDVTLTGTTLNPTCTASFGGRPATRSAGAGITMTATSPSHPPGTVAVSVTCADGQTFTLNNAYTFVNATPTIAAATPSFGNTGGGTIVRVTGTNLLSSCGVTFDGVLGTDIVLESPTSVLVAAPRNAEKRATVGIACPTGVAVADSAFIYTTSDEPTASLSGLDRVEAAPGQTLMIKGTRFRGSDAITIGDAPATILRTTPEAHFVRVPELPAGVVAVTLRDLNGRISTTGPIFAILPAAAPRIDSATAIGTEIELTGNGFRPALAFALGDVTLQAVSLDYTRATVRAPRGTSGTFPLSAGGVAGPSVTLTSGVALHGVSPRCAATEGGVPVRISGSGFTAGTRVTFGGLDAASVTVVDSSTLTALVPAGDIGISRVVVTTPDGSRAALSDAFTYTSRFQPDSTCGRQRSARH